MCYKENFSTLDNTKTNLYRCLKHRLLCSLRSKLYRRALVSGKTPSHQPFRDEGMQLFWLCNSSRWIARTIKSSSPQTIHWWLIPTGQHKISRTLFSNVENPHLVSSKQYNTQSKTCTELTQPDNRQHLKEEPDPINRVVIFSTNLQINL